MKTQDEQWGYVIIILFVALIAIGAILTVSQHTATHYHYDTTTNKTVYEDWKVYLDHDRATIIFAMIEQLKLTLDENGTHRRYISDDLYDLQVGFEYGHNATFSLTQYLDLTRALNSSIIAFEVVWDHRLQNPPQDHGETIITYLDWGELRAYWLTKWFVWGDAS